MNLLRHGWLKFVKREPPVVYRGEYQMLASLLERRGADLMHIYFGHTGVHLLPFIEQWHKPCVVSFHGADVSTKEDVPNYEQRLRRMFRAVPLVLARSRSLADRLVQLGCPAERLRLNRTGVPLADFPLIQRDVPNDGHWCLLQACRLIPKKGVATSIRAFAVLQKQFPNAEFFIAGKGPLQPQLEILISQLGIADKVHFCGFLSQPELVKLYARAHLFLHPSETPADQNQEGVPNSVLEAMSTGLPVVATRHGGIPEAVEHGRTGLLVAEGDFVALADAVAGLLQNPARYERDGFAREQIGGGEFRAGRTDSSARILLRRSDRGGATGGTGGDGFRHVLAADAVSGACPGGLSVSAACFRVGEKGGKSLVIRAKTALICATQAPLVSRA